MSSNDEDDFYVGYMKTAPGDLGKTVRRWIIGLVLLTTVCAGLISVTQENFSNGKFEFGKPQLYGGVVRLDPVPVAMADLALDESPIVRPQYHLLVNQGKFGAASLFRDLEGRKVNFMATRIHRDGQEMLEVVPGSIKDIDIGTPQPPASVPLSLGTHTFHGEIVDSKCYLGVMSPGNLKTHKACAIRCISGGIPPVLVVRDGSDKPLYLILIGPQGEALNEHVLDKIAEPVEITGAAEKRDGFYYLRAAPEAIKRK